MEPPGGSQTPVPVGESRCPRDGFHEERQRYGQQSLKDAIQHAVLGPTIHASVDGVPVAKSLRQSAPFAPMLGYVKQRVEHLRVGKADIASLARKTGLDTKILRLGDIQGPKPTIKSQLV